MASLSDEFLSHLNAVMRDRLQLASPLADSGEIDTHLALTQRLQRSLSRALPRIEVAVLPQDAFAGLCCSTPPAAGLPVPPLMPRFHISSQDVPRVSNTNAVASSWGLGPQGPFTDVAHATNGCQSHCVVTILIEATGMRDLGKAVLKEMMTATTVYPPPRGTASETSRLVDVVSLAVFAAPHHNHGWNRCQRRFDDALRSTDSQPPPPIDDVLHAVLRELIAVGLAVARQAKSPEAWHHRGFVWDRLRAVQGSRSDDGLVDDWDAEWALDEQEWVLRDAIERHPRNYHAWEYLRRVTVARLKQLVSRQSDEEESCLLSIAQMFHPLLQMIDRHPTEATAVHVLIECTRVVVDGRDLDVTRPSWQGTAGSFLLRHLWTWCHNKVLWMLRTLGTSCLSQQSSPSSRSSPVPPPPSNSPVTAPDGWNNMWRLRTGLLLVLASPSESRRALLPWTIADEWAWWHAVWDALGDVVVGCGAAAPRDGFGRAKLRDPNCDDAPRKPVPKGGRVIAPDSDSEDEPRKPVPKGGRVIAPDSDSDDEPRKPVPKGGRVIAPDSDSEDEPRKSVPKGGFGRAKPQGAGRFSRPSPLPVTGPVCIYGSVLHALCHS